MTCDDYIQHSDIPTYVIQNVDILGGILEDCNIPFHRLYNRFDSDIETVLLD